MEFLLVTLTLLSMALFFVGGVIAFFGVIVGRRPKPGEDGLAAVRARQTALFKHLLPEVVCQDGELLTDEFVEGTILPPPNFFFSTDQVSLKILPSDAVNPKLAEPLFEHLYHINEQLHFEFVVEHGRAYFQVRCAKSHQEYIERQFLIHFPGSVVQEVPSYVSHDVDNLLASHWYRYTLGCAPSNTLGDFRIDPYKYLFTIADKLSADQLMAFRVECAPIASEAVRRVVSRGSSHLYRTSMDERTYSRFAKIVEAKLPAWAMRCVLLASPSPPDGRIDEFYREQESFFTEMSYFFGQYRTQYQGWEMYREQEWHTINRFPPVLPRLGDTPHTLSHRSLPYCVVSCAELAALAHLPGKDVRIDRLEAASKTRIPPPPSLYIEPR